MHEIPSPVPLTELFYPRSKRLADRISSYSKVDGVWVGTTWNESRTAVEESAMGLLAIGAERGAPVAIMSQTRREWSQMDMATISIGGITIGIYPTLTGAQACQLLELSGARIVFVDSAVQREKIQSATKNLDPPVQIITMEQEVNGANTITHQELRRQGRARKEQQPEELERRLQEIKVTDCVSYIYTSGTTGEPKGAELTHANFHYVIHATNAVVPYDGERALVFLPLAHSLQRYGAYLGLIADNIDGYYSESLDTVQEYLLEVRPSIFALVPRVLEKIHAKALAVGRSGTPVRQRIFETSLSVLSDVGSTKRGGGMPGLTSRLFARAADRMVGSRIRDRLGGRVKFIGSGGAPLARSTHEFFENIGIPILEGYGLTETSAPACLNTLQNRRIGTVGRPLPGTEIRIAEDKEVLIRGPGVFSGYFQNEMATKEAFDGEGWFKSGDLGEMDRDGYLRITDRKKEIIVTAGGKNIAPQPIESELKRHPYVSQAVVIGDRRPCLTALFTLDPEAVEQLADRYGIQDDGDAKSIAALPLVKQTLSTLLEQVNAGRPSFEQIKTFEVLPTEMTIESGELTPTLKVKRRVINDRYAEVIDRIYSAP